MPLKSEVTPDQPLRLHVDVDRNGHLPRGRASRRQSNTLSSSKWPIVTRTAYEQLTRGEKVPEELSNLRMRRLAMGRNALGVALLQLQGAMHEFGPTKAPPGKSDEYARVWKSLRVAYDAVEKNYTGYPMEVR